MMAKRNEKSKTNKKSVAVSQNLSKGNAIIDNRPSIVLQRNIIQQIKKGKTNDLSSVLEIYPPSTSFYQVPPIQKLELVRDSNKPEEKFHLPEGDEIGNPSLVKIYTHNMGDKDCAEAEDGGCGPPFDEIEPRLHTAVNVELGMIAAAEQKVIDWTPTGEYKAKSRKELFEYSQDDLGRTTEVYSFIDRVSMGRLKGSHVSTAVKKKLATKVGWREDLDNGGHIVGTQFGGSGQSNKNVVMQDADKNSEFATKFENPIEAKIRALGQADVRWGVEYYGDSWRPNLMSIQAVYPNGEVMGGAVTNPPADPIAKATQLKPAWDYPMQLLKAEYPASPSFSVGLEEPIPVLQRLVANLEGGGSKEIHLMNVKELEWVIENYPEDSKANFEIIQVAQSALNVEESEDLDKLEKRYNTDYAYLSRLRRRFKVMDPNYHVLSLINIVYRVGLESAIPDFKDWLAFFAQTKENVDDEEFLDFIVELRSAETLINRDMNPMDSINIGEDNQITNSKSFDQKVSGSGRTRNVEIKHIRTPVKDTKPIWFGIEHAAEKHTKGLQGTVEAMVILRFYRTPDSELDIEPIYKGDGIYSSTRDSTMQRIQNDLVNELRGYKEVDVLHILSDDTDRYWKFVRQAKEWSYEEI